MKSALRLRNDEAGTSRRHGLGPLLVIPGVDVAGKVGYPIDPRRLGVPVVRDVIDVPLIPINVSSRAIVVRRPSVPPAPLQATSWRHLRSYPSHPTRPSGYRYPASRCQRGSPRSRRAAPSILSPAPGAPWPRGTLVAESSRRLCISPDGRADPESSVAEAEEGTSVLAAVGDRIRGDIGFARRAG